MNKLRRLLLVQQQKKLAISGRASHPSIVKMIAGIRRLGVIATQQGTLVSSALQVIDEDGPHSRAKLGTFMRYSAYSTRHVMELIFQTFMFLPTSIAQLSAGDFSIF